MKSAYYTFTAWDEGQLAAGFGGGLDNSRQAVILRQPAQKARSLGGDNVIDLAAWRAANQGQWDEPSQEYEAAVPELDIPAPRARRSHRRARLYSELASTLAVAGVALALLVRVLAF